MSLQVDIEIASDCSGIPSEAQFEQWCAIALREREASELAIRIVDEAEGRELNNTYRHKDYATNVLSFPADLPPELGLPLIGDLAICAPVVLREAGEHNKGIEAHWAHMVIHGCLHLQGYDHIEDSDADVMEALERKLLAELGYPDPYHEEE